MADGKGSGAAQNELGQLFVDIGVNGVGKALKQLNSVAASFLLGKNAATQFAQTLTQPFKEAGNTAVEIGKMSEALATTSIEYQKLAMYMKKYNLSQSLIGDVNKMEKFLKQYNEGLINISDNMALGFTKAGIDIQRGKYKGTFEGAVKFFDDLQQKTANKSKEDRNFILDLLGLNNEWGYAFSKGGFRAGDYYTIPDEAVKANQSLQESMNELKNTLDNLWYETLSKIAPYLEQIANFCTEWLKNWGKEGGVNKTVEATKTGVNTGKKVVSETEKAIMRNPYGAILMGTSKYLWHKGKEKLFNNNNQIDGALTGGAANILPDAGNGVPTGMTQNITNNITHDITINGDNAQAIAKEIAGISEQDIQYSQYQSANLAGL